MSTATSRAFFFGVPAETTQARLERGAKATPAGRLTLSRLMTLKPTRSTITARPLVCVTTARVPSLDTAIACGVPGSLISGPSTGAGAIVLMTVTPPLCAA